MHHKTTGVLQLTRASMIEKAQNNEKKRIVITVIDILNSFLKKCVGACKSKKHHKPMDMYTIMYIYIYIRRVGLSRYHLYLHYIL